MIDSMFNPHLLGFECLACSARTEPDSGAPVCPDCGRPLVARYDLASVRSSWRRDDLDRFGKDLWRWSPVLPFADTFRPARLGEGGTPLLAMPRLAAALDIDELRLTD